MKKVFELSLRLVTQENGIQDFLHFIEDNFVVESIKHPKSLVKSNYVQPNVRYLKFIKMKRVL